MPEWEGVRPRPELSASLKLSIWADKITGWLGEVLQQGQSTEAVKPEQEKHALQERAENPLRRAGMSLHTDSKIAGAIIA